MVAMFLSRSIRRHTLFEPTNKSFRLVVSERRYFKAGQSETGSASTGNVFHYIKTKCCTFVESLSYMIATMIGYNHQNGFIKDYKYVKW